MLILSKNNNKPLIIYSVQKTRSSIRKSVLDFLVKGMNMRSKIMSITLLILIVLTSSDPGKTNCERSLKETKSVHKGTATFVNVQISFLGGTMDISGGSKELMNAKFEYSETEWKPDVEYAVKNKIGNLKVCMPDAEDDISISDDDLNEWNIQLNNDIPMDLCIKLGGGEGDYDLSQLRMNSLEIRLGGGKLDINLKESSLPRFDFKAIAGEATVDLSGKWENNLDADFICGVGELTLKLPKNVGVQVKATGILGNIDAPGFSKEGSIYTNDMFRKTKVTLYIDIFGGIGNVNLELIE